MKVFLKRSEQSRCHTCTSNKPLKYIQKVENGRFQLSLAKIHLNLSLFVIMKNSKTKYYHNESKEQLSIILSIAFVILTAALTFYCYILKPNKIDSKLVNSLQALGDFIDVIKFFKF
jgi:hypothetical protein